MKTSLFILTIGLIVTKTCYSQNDTLKEFYQIGKPKIITPRINGKKNGVEIKYRNDGTLRSETNYVNDTI